MPVVQDGVLEGGGVGVRRQTTRYTAPMFRRWLIRSLSLTLLTMCVVAWVGSYGRCVGIEYAGTKTTYGVDTNSGCIVVVRHFRYLGTGGWVCINCGINRQGFEEWQQSTKYHAAGFASDSGLPPSSDWTVFIPALVSHAPLLPGPLVRLAEDKGQAARWGVSGGAGGKGKVSGRQSSSPVRLAA